MNKQNYYRAEYIKIKPLWNSSLAIYKNIVNSTVKPDSYLLDIGCGHGKLLKNIYNKVKRSYGLDPDKASLDKNKYIHNKIVGTVYNMPFKNNFFDIVILEWVLEHISNPDSAFKEIYRVLKPNGKVVFITPNTWNYNVILIRLTPNFLHSFLTKKLYNRQEGDTYPVKYKINTTKKINKILYKIGFQKQNIILNGDPSYTSFNDLTFKISVILEKIMDIRYLNFLRIHLISIFEKPKY